MVPVYVATGFLDAGKTTFLNRLFYRRRDAEIRRLFLQFESGEEELEEDRSPVGSVRLVFTKKELEGELSLLSRKIEKAIGESDPDEIWIEWNGTAPFSLLQTLLAHGCLKDLCRLDRVVHLADPFLLQGLPGGRDGVLAGQVRSCDMVLLRSTLDFDANKKSRQLIRSLNPGVKIYNDKDISPLDQALYKKKESPVDLLVLRIVLLVALYFLTNIVFDTLDLPFNTLVNVFLGMILSALPFLVIGVLLSTAISLFIPAGFIQRKFPRSLGGGILAAVVAGFCLPVCDCASIPVFKSLVRKGIPLPAAIIFLTASPVINPVVLWSTYYAFGGNWSIVLGRAGLGLLTALLTGLSFAFFPPKATVLTRDTSSGVLGQDASEDSLYYTGNPSDFKGWSQKAALYLRHSRSEFFKTGKYLAAGIFVSALFQIFAKGLFSGAQQGSGLVLAIGFMMVMAFVLSLCSSSDAVVARSFAGAFPQTAVMGFLVFGPMMDIKNVLMLSSGFNKGFIARLSITAFSICFILVYLFGGR